MNLKQIVIAMSILASAGGAMAVEARQWNPQAGEADRAAVKAEFLRARASGTLDADRGELYGSFHDASPRSTLARAEVKQELARARAGGELDANRGELYGSFRDKQPKSTLTRAEVTQELARARANGELDGDRAESGSLPQGSGRFVAWRKTHPSDHGVN